MAATLDFQYKRFELFLSTSGSNTSYHISSQFAFWFRKSNANWVSKMAVILPKLLNLISFVAISHTALCLCSGKQTSNAEQIRIFMSSSSSVSIV